MRSSLTEECLTQSELLRTSVLTVGENKGTPRIWIQGKYLQMAGFEPGRRIRATYGQNQIVITLAEKDGDHRVSSVRRNGRCPIIDYQNRQLRTALKDASKVEVRTAYGRIVITPAYTELKRAARKSDGSLGSVFSGGGLLDEASRLAGYRSRFAVEINPDYADIWQSNHRGHMHCGCISEINLRQLPQVDLLVIGIPCEPFSHKRRQQGNQRRLTRGPADHELADMSFWSLLVVDQCNPSTVIIENVPAYVQSEVGMVTMAVLRRMGYTVEHRVVVGTQYGAATTRKRAVIVAACDSRIRWPELVEHHRRLGDLLLPPDHPECRWFHRSDPNKRWLFEHWARQSAKGNGFSSQQLTPDSDSVQAISKRYFAGQGDAPVVRDTRLGREGWFRWLTLGEVKSIIGVRLGYDLGFSQTTAGEILGQGVLVDVFRQIIESVAPRSAAEPTSQGCPCHTLSRLFSCFLPNKAPPEVTVY